MKGMVFRRILRTVLIVGGLAASAAAEAQTATTSYPVSATCTGGGQLCNNVASIPITSTGVLLAQFTGGPLLCSNIRIHFLVDGTAVAVTPFVGASASTGFLNLGPVSPGAHTVGLQAEGQVGGCNVGTLGSWAGTAQITTGTGVIPTLSDFGLAFLLTLVGVVGVLQLRKRRLRT